MEKIYRLLLEELEALTEIDADLFTGFDFADMPEMDVYAENGKDNKLDADEVGAMYEVVFKSESKEKIEKIKEAWELMADD